MDARESLHATPDARQVEKTLVPIEVGCVWFLSRLFRRQAIKRETTDAFRSMSIRRTERPVYVVHAAANSRTK